MIAGFMQVASQIHQDIPMPDNRTFCRLTIQLTSYRKHAVPQRFGIEPSQAVTSEQQILSVSLCERFFYITAQLVGPAKDDTSN